MDKLVDKLMDNVMDRWATLLFNRVRKTPPLHFTEMEKTSLWKPCHFPIPHTKTSYTACNDSDKENEDHARDNEHKQETSSRQNSSVMQVVGLISGGKDSIFNLHYCAHLGHTVVALANLEPPKGKQELDSYMYQTVGSDVVQAIARSMGLPLIRHIPTCKTKVSNKYKINYFHFG